MSDSSEPLSRAEVLSIARATEGLDDDARREWALLHEREPSVMTDEYDRAAAAVALAMLEPLETMPETLASRLVDRATEHPGPPPRPDRPPRSVLRPWLGWAVAAVAVLLLMLLPLRRPALIVPPRAPVVMTMAPESPAPPSAAESRQRLLRDDPDATIFAWSAGGHASGARVSGDVVWSERAQSGFMSLRGLRPNDPSREVYQLWIFDAARDERHPVDGGVFDIAPRVSEQLVPIDAKLPITKATLFAVTVERPGGVVVSDRSRLAALAGPTP